MKNKILISLLTASLAMNLGVATMYSQKLFQTRNILSQKTCPFSSDDSQLYKLLKLNPEQLDAIKLIAADFHQNIGNLSSEVQEKRTVMMVMMEQDDIDLGKVDAARHGIWSLQSKIQQTVFEHILQMKKILTPEQRKIFFQTMRQSFVQQSLNCSQ